MSSPDGRHHWPSGRLSKAITLLFAVLGATLIYILVFYWLQVLEPRLTADAASRARVLSQAHSHHLTKVLSGDPAEITPEKVSAAANEILALRDPTTDKPFIRGIVLEVDYDLVPLPRGALDLRLGDTGCGDCFKAEIFLQHERTLELAGIATFYASPHFLQQLTASLREKLVWGGGIALLVILLAWAGVHQLVCRQQESETNLRNVFSAAPLPLLLLDARTLELLLANREASGYLTRLLGCPAPIGDREWREWGNTPHGTVILDLVRNQISHREACLSEPGAAPLWALLSTVPLSYHGKPGLLIALADITPLKLAQEELRLAKESAEQATRAKSTFLATMSHEIRTPLNGILGMAQLMEFERMTPSQREQVRAIRWAGDALLSLVNDVLDFSRIEAGRLELDHGDFEIQQVINSTLAIIHARAREKGLELQIDLAPEVGRRYRGDLNRIRQILVNLLGNAVKFTERGWIRLEIGVDQRGEACERLAFRVSDSGIGIDAEILPRLFEEFTQSDSGITRRFGGTGLGLAISRRLVELMAGSISATSQPGEGSCFEVVIPLEPIQSTPLPAAVSPPSASPLRLLVVDDVELNRRVLRGLFRGGDHQIHEANDGAAALTKVAEQDFDLILLDLYMPVMDGFDAALQIRALQDPRKSKVPIVAVTADVTPEARQRCVACGFDDLLAKPIQPGELDRLLHKLNQRQGLTAFPG